jgi:very-short-patch-repair endonuclease
MEHQDAEDGWIRALAEAQHGVVARRQLLEGGMPASRIRSWIAGGRLARRHRGVYTMGHALLAREGVWMAAVLACGPRAVLSHSSAAALWGIRPPTGGDVDVTVPLGGPRTPGAGVRPHQSGLVVDRFSTDCDGIPVTTLAWTLLDLAAVLPAHQLRRAVEQSERLEIFDLQAVEAAVAAAPRRPGSPAVHALLADMKDHGVTRTRSDVEAAMLQICIDHGIPRPQVNRYDGGREVDFRWPAHRLIVEIDGWAFHRTRRAFAADRARDRAALLDGWRTARFPAIEIERQPKRVAGELIALLQHDGL